MSGHPRQRTIRFEMMASMARALASSMQRNNSTEHSSMPDGSKQFASGGRRARARKWEEGNAGGDRMHTSFVDNPQFILRAKPGTNLCLVLHDVDEDKRQREKVKTRPLFLRLCVTAASEDVRSMPLEFRRRPPARPAHRPCTHAPYPRLCARPRSSYRCARGPSSPLARPRPRRRSSRSQDARHQLVRRAPRRDGRRSCRSDRRQRPSTSRRRARSRCAATSRPRRPATRGWWCPTSAAPTSTRASCCRSSPTRR